MYTTIVNKSFLESMVFISESVHSPHVTMLSFVFTASKMQEFTKNMSLKQDLFAILLLPDSMVVQWQPKDINRGNAVFKTLLCHYACEEKGGKYSSLFSLFHHSFLSHHHTK